MEAAGGYRAIRRLFESEDSGMSKNYNGMRSIDVKLFDLRTDRGMTLKEVADKSKIAPSTLHYYEQGKSSPTLDTLIKILNVYNVSVEDFLGAKATEYVQDLDVFKKYRLNEAFFQQLLINNKSGIYQNESYFDMAAILNLITEEPLYSFEIFEALNRFFSDSKQKDAVKLIDQFGTKIKSPFPDGTALRMLFEPVVKAFVDFCTYKHLDDAKGYLTEFQRQRAEEGKAGQESIIEEIRTQQNAEKRHQGG